MPSLRTDSKVGTCAGALLARYVIGPEDREKPDMAGGKGPVNNSSISVNMLSSLRHLDFRKSSVPPEIQS